MTPTEIKDALLKIIQEKKVDDLTVIDVAEQTEIADYMIIMTGKNNNNVRMLSDHIGKSGHFCHKKRRRSGRTLGRSRLRQCDRAYFQQRYACVL